MAVVRTGKSGIQQILSVMTVRLEAVLAVGQMGNLNQLPAYVTPK